MGGNGIRAGDTIRTRWEIAGKGDYPDSDRRRGTSGLCRSDEVRMLGGRRMK